MTASPKPRYDEGCLAAHALNLIGDRWALLVVRELMLTPKRFVQIRAGLPGITAGVLTGRLKQLVVAGVVTHDTKLGIYALTEAGRELRPVLIALCKWGVRQPGHDPTRFISPTSLMLSMTCMVSTAAQGQRIVAGFDMGTEQFVMRLTGDGQPRPEAVDNAEGDFVLSGDGNSLATAIYGSVPLVDLAAQGIIGLSGDAQIAQRFTDLFALRQATSS
ncbi:MAG: transcriptional regulator [Gammaproteobacteria bacterium]|nr:MAG: transcriptional regulator [Gammaproteobacteria bacterium]